jgi:hypothetical protein
VEKTLESSSVEEPSPVEKTLESSSVEEPPTVEKTLESSSVEKPPTVEKTLESSSVEVPNNEPEKEEKPSFLGSLFGQLPKPPTPASVAPASLARPQKTPVRPANITNTIKKMLTPQPVI